MQKNLPSSSVFNLLPAIVTALGLLQSQASFAQTPGSFKGVDMQFPQRMMSNGFFASPSDVALQKQMFDKGLSAINTPRISPTHNENFSLALEESEIENQKKAGICWIESMTNKVEIEAISKNKLLRGTPLSRSYIFFYYLLERAGMFVDGLIDLRTSKTSMTGKDLLAAVSNPGIPDGQDPVDFEVVANKWGMVPMDLMPTSATLKDDTEFMTEYNRYLTEVGYRMLNYSVNFTADRPLSVETTNVNQSFQLAPLTPAEQAQLQSMKETILTGVWKILVRNFGAPPAQFAFKIPGTSNVQNFTPKAFANYLGMNIQNWVLVANMFNFERGKAYHVNNYPSLNGGFLALNLTADRMAQLMEQELTAGRPVPFVMLFDDVMNGINEKSNGDIITGSVGSDAAYSFEGNQAPPNLSTLELERLGLLNADHALIITGLDRTPGTSLPQPWIKARVENSWGKQSGYQGNYALYYDSFIRDVGAIFVDYSSLSPDEQKAMQDPNMPTADYNDTGDIGSYRNGKGSPAVH